LRRFALAMTGGRVPVLGQHAAVVEAVGAGWRSGPLVVARRRRQRRRGLRPRPAGRGLLLRARSVHGFGMREAVGVVSLGGAGRVRRVAVLPPGGFFWDPGADWVMELPLSRPPPPVGVTLCLLARLSSRTGGGPVC
jgi:hypothetical protein